MTNLNVEIISVEGYVFQGEAHQVVVPCVSGAVGVLAGHEHLVSELNEGKIQILDNGDKVVKEIDVKGGTAEIHGENDLRVLVEV